MTSADPGHSPAPRPGLPRRAPLHDGRSVVQHAGLAVAFLFAPGAGWSAYYVLVLTSWPSSADRSTRLEASIAVGIVAGVLVVLAALVLVAFRPQPWVHVLAALAVAVTVWLAVDVHTAAGQTPPPVIGDESPIEPENVGIGLLVAAAVPTSWPLLAFAVGAVRRLRGRSSRGPRSPQAPSSAPDRRR